jgi:dipeptidyl aminopeptidase/acylaminoacyl peptidase
MMPTRDPDPGFDPRLSDWLEADPGGAPAQLLDTVLAAIPSIPQRRAWRVPWRPAPMNRLLLAGATIAAVVAVGVGASFLRSPTPGTGGTATPSAADATPNASPAPSESVLPGDYSRLPGRILAEHLGNALDLSESDATDYNPDKRRFYLLDPADMSNASAVEFLPGMPASGKTAADVSFDGRRVVFQDWAEKPRLYEANLDGSGFHQIPTECDCQLLYPDYDPTATKIVYVRIEDGESWLETRDLERGETTPLEATRGPAADDVPEQPAWSPDGKSIAFSRLRWGVGRNDPVVGTVRYGDKPPMSGVLSVLDLTTGDVRDLALPNGTLPGDVNWSPDSATLVFSHVPGSTTGSVSNMPSGGARSIGVDGTGFRSLPGGSGPRYLPDGSKILVQNNWFYLMDPDGSDLRPVNHAASDLSDLPQGFVYIGHWIDDPEG